MRQINFYGTQCNPPPRGVSWTLTKWLLSLSNVYLGIMCGNAFLCFFLNTMIYPVSQVFIEYVYILSVLF